MSHEIRTPLTAVLGYAELLAEGRLAAAEAAFAAEVIHRNGAHLLHVVDEILDLSRLKAHRMEPGRLATDLPALIGEVQAAVGAAAAAKGLALRIELDPALPNEIVTDPMRLKQILLNLLGNAVKFTPSGEVRLAARRGADPEAPRIVFEVSDTGIGIPSARLHRLFQAFEQSDASIAGRFGGTGLGLSISRRLARLLGGDITVQSRAGHGSTFCVSICAPLPARLLLPAPEEHPERHSRGPDFRHPTLGGRRILLVEDCPDSRRLLAYLLRKAGAAVTTASDGRQAVAVALKACEGGDPFDLVLMDVDLPVLSGPEAVRELRRRGYGGPIVALTAHVLEAERQRCATAGFDEYLCKPVEHGRLIETARRLSARDDPFIAARQRGKVIGPSGHQRRRKRSSTSTPQPSPAGGRARPPNPNRTDRRVTSPRSRKRP